MVMLTQAEKDFADLDGRDRRDALLTSTDWWTLEGKVMTSEQIAYRQALRDIPEQEGFPDAITWPTKPE